MSDLAIRLGSREIDLFSLVKGLGLPVDLTDAVKTIFDDPIKALETVRTELQEKFFRRMMIRPLIDNRGNLDWRMAALMALFRDLDFDLASPNPTLSCAFKPGSEDTRLFS